MEAYRLQRISPLDVIGKRAANVREEPSLILGILRALEASSAARRLRYVPASSGCCLTASRDPTASSRTICAAAARASKKLFFLNHPAITKRLDVPRSFLSILCALLALHSDRISTCALEHDLVTDLGLGEGLRDRALDVLSPHLARTVPRSESHEIRRILVRVMPVAIPAVVDEPAVRSGERPSESVGGFKASSIRPVYLRLISATSCRSPRRHEFLRSGHALADDRAPEKVSMA